MKNFVKENWYKLMIGSSMMMASFGFMIYAISPAYSNTDKKLDVKYNFNGVSYGVSNIKKITINGTVLDIYMKNGSVYAWNVTKRQ